MRRSSRILGFGGSGALVIAGIVCAIAFSSTLGTVLAFILISAGLVIATSLVFLEVGLSEDREREHEDARRQGQAAQRKRERRPEAVERAGAARPRERQGANDGWVSASALPVTSTRRASAPQIGRRSGDG